MLYWYGCLFGQAKSCEGFGVALVLPIQGAKMSFLLATSNISPVQELLRDPVDACEKARVCGCLSRAKRKIVAMQLNQTGTLLLSGVGGSSYSLFNGAKRVACRFLSTCGPSPRRRANGLDRSGSLAVGSGHDACDERAGKPLTCSAGLPAVESCIF